jgi:outer membrane lipopolysaccharide assembly protein LptE/RlpB
MLVSSMMAGCAGYQLGNHTLFPQHIRTVHVPVFQSDSLRRNLGERLTEAVIKQIELRSSYKVVGPAAADSVLVGRIVADERRVLVEDLNDNAREMETTLRAQVSWTTSRGETIGQPMVIPLPAALVEVGSSGNYVPEVGQSLLTNQQDVIDRLASDIVGMMENAW